MTSKRRAWFAAAVVAAACGGKAIVDGKPAGAGGASATSGAGGGAQMSSSATFTDETATGPLDAMPTCGPKPTNCQEACAALWCCMNDNGNCPAVSPMQQGEFQMGCLGACQAQPPLVAIVDPFDCKGTITTLASIDMQFNNLCKGGTTPK
jgi:hypothetical protein